MVLCWFFVWFLFGWLCLVSSLVSFCSLFTYPACSVPHCFLFLFCSVSDIFCFFFGSLPSYTPVLFRLSFRLLFTSSVFYLPSFLLCFVYFWFLSLRLTKINKNSKQTSKHKFKVHENIYILVVLFCCIQHKHRALRRKFGPTCG